MRLVTVSAIAAAAVVAGGLVLANEGVARHDFMRHHIEGRIDAALDAAKATPEQRATLDKTKTKVFAALEASHQNQRAGLDKLLQLFEADQIDANQLKALRSQHEAIARADGDAITQAMIEAHDTLQPAQRRALAEHVRAHKPDAPPKAVGEWFKKRALSHVSDALDAVKATEVQRAAVDNALEQVWNAVKDEHQASAGHLDEAVKLFEADHLDRTQIDKLRAERQARHQKIGDAIVQAFHDVHDALTSAQRKQLVDWVRANHPHMGG